MRRPTLLLLLFLSLLLLAAVPLAAQTVLCESVNGTYRECRVGTSGTIRMVMEMSDRACYENSTWGTRSIGMVWVDRGCRATFTVAEPQQLARKQKNRVICESQNGGREVCPAETVKGVTLTRQLSQTACRQGENWGTDSERGTVWVDHGCRAEFHIGRNETPALPAAALDSIVPCESENNKRKDCKTDTSAGVQIVRQLSDNPCGFDREWGYDANGIWVTKGCRAEFAVRGKKALARAVTCESMNQARNHCEAETRFGVAIVRQLSESECALGKSWGFDETGVWVSEGCHAQFALGGYRLPAEAVPPTAVKMTCESLDGGRKQCPVETSRGVGLLRQISGADCVLNRSWGYDRTGIWVTDGCRAEFVVAR